MRYNYLDGIRSLAIFLVFNVHFFGMFAKYNYYSDGYLKEIFKILHSGHIGVDLFFVLSGYLIYASIARYKDFHFKSYLKFIVARFKRLFPAHATVLLMLSLIIPVSVGTFISNALFLNAGMNYVAWSLMYEWAFYIIWGALFVFSYKKIIQEKAAITILATIFLVLVFLIPSEYIIRSLGFIFGILIYKYKFIFENIKSIRFKVSALILSVTAVLCGLYLWADASMTIIQINLMFLMINLAWALLLITVLASKRLQLIFSSAPLVALGLASYSFYLVHATAIEVILKHIFHVDSFNKMVCAYFICFALSYAVAFIILKSIEFSFLKKGWIYDTLYAFIALCQKNKSKKNYSE